jgi:prepilin-type N-terminal cleavage/methylation domain-containing protein
MSSAGSNFVKTVRRSSAFTLLELLIVIAIMGILAALTVPALKNLGRSNVQTSASRQLLDDVARARQLAISQHTTVYMVFVPTNFYNSTFLGNLNNAANILADADRVAALTAATNLVASQLTGYNFISYGKLGDQPGRHQWHYLDSWKALPNGNMIAAQKFLQATPFQIQEWQRDYNRPAINNFSLALIPFPTEVSPAVYLPFIAFNYLGQMTSDGVSISTRDEFIPLAQGYVNFPLDVATKSPAMTSLSTVTENPPGNSTNISYNVVHVDALTGRATLEFYQIK